VLPQIPRVECKPKTSQGFYSIGDRLLRETVSIRVDLLSCDGSRFFPNSNHLIILFLALFILFICVSVSSLVFPSCLFVFLSAPFFFPLVHPLVGQSEDWDANCRDAMVLLLMSISSTSRILFLPGPTRLVKWNYLHTEEANKEKEMSSPCRLSIGGQFRQALSVSRPPGGKTEHMYLNSDGQWEESKKTLRICDATIDDRRDHSFYFNRLT
jgi:hypothetical protein